MPLTGPKRFDEVESNYPFVGRSFALFVIKYGIGPLSLKKLLGKLLENSTSMIRESSD
ncbi:unnamed protein product, partial [Ceratitis capitata]